MTPNDLEARPKQKVDRKEESTRPGAYFQPAVDIFETPEELLVLAFVDEAIAEIEDEGLADEMRSRLAAWLVRRRK